MIQPYRLGSLFLAFVLLLSASVAPIAAQEQADPPLTEQSTYEAFSGIVDEYNAQQSESGGDGWHADTVGVGVMQYFLAGERVNVYVTDTETGAVEEFSFAVRDDLTVADVQEYKSVDATARVDVSRATVEDIMLAEEPLTRLKWHVFEGNVAVRGERGDVADQLAWTLAKSGEYEVRKRWYYYRLANRAFRGDLSYNTWRYLWKEMFSL